MYDSNICMENLLAMTACMQIAPETESNAFLITGFRRQLQSTKLVRRARDIEAKCRNVSLLRTKEEEENARPLIFLSGSMRALKRTQDDMSWEFCDALPFFRQKSDFRGPILPLGIPTLGYFPSKSHYVQLETKMRKCCLSWPSFVLPFLFSFLPWSKNG